MQRFSQGLETAVRMSPGVGLCALLAVSATLIGGLEARWLGRAWMEPLALSILLGMTVRTVWTPDAGTAKGIAFAGKTVLEIAVAILGATISIQALGATGPLLLVGVIAAVAISIAASYTIGRTLGLSRNLATLVACGNSICGNSAIAAVAPIIDAEGADVAASIAFTAVLGVVVVAALPYLAPLLHLKPFAYGVVAGLTVYAVPQVVAATAPIGAVAMQTGTLVKLTRVLTLGPVMTGVAALNRAFPASCDDAPTVLGRPANRIAAPVLPWFLIAFAIFTALRSTGLLSDHLATIAASASSALTGLAMAALGLMVDVLTVLQAGARVSITAVLSITTIGLLACGLIRLLGLT